MMLVASMLAGFQGSGYSLNLELLQRRVTVFRTDSGVVVVVRIGRGHLALGAFFWSMVNMGDTLAKSLSSCRGSSPAQSSVKAPIKRGD
jgi:hypothetical protein